MQFESVGSPRWRRRDTRWISIFCILHAAFCISESAFAAPPPDKVALTNVKIIPVVGDLYLFPAWLTHLVYPFEGAGERISYSFNLLVRNIGMAEHSSH